MGANYDFVISSADAAEQRIENFLAARDRAVLSVAELGAVQIDDDNVVLISPSRDGLVQVVAPCFALGIDLADWYEVNPLAAALSEHEHSSLHVWSLNSGFVAGYSAYDEGMKVEADHEFSKHANHTDQLMESVKTPRTLKRNTLRKFLRAEEPTVISEWKKDGDLEQGIACLMAHMGFDAHLVDFFDALDDQEGIAVSDDNSFSVHLSAWKAIVFNKSSKSP